MVKQRFPNARMSGKLHFTQLSFQPCNKWGLVCAVHAVLAGRTELSFSTGWRLRLFFFLAWLKRLVAVAGRLKSG